MLRSRNYLFSAPAPTLYIISAPAPAIYCHINLNNSSTVFCTGTDRCRNQLFFVLASFKLPAENVYLNLFSAPAPGPQIISAPSAPQHWCCGSAFFFFFGSGIPKISIRFRIQGGKHKRRKITPKNFQLNRSK